MWKSGLQTLTGLDIKATLKKCLFPVDRVGINNHTRLAHNFFYFFRNNFFWDNHWIISNTRVKPIWKSDKKWLKYHQNVAVDRKRNYFLVSPKVLVLPAPGQVILNFYLPKYKIYLPTINRKLSRVTYLKTNSQWNQNLTCPMGRFISSFTCPTQDLPAPGRWAMFIVEPWIRNSLLPVGRRQETHFEG